MRTEIDIDCVVGEKSGVRTLCGFNDLENDSATIGIDRWFAASYRTNPRRMRTSDVVAVRTDNIVKLFRLGN